MFSLVNIVLFIVQHIQRNRSKLMIILINRNVKQSSTQTNITQTFFIMRDIIWYGKTQIL